MIGYGNSYFISTILDSGGGVSGIPVNTVAPVISGTSVVGYTLTSTTGTWTGNPTPTYTYQWYRGVNAIGGATTNTYTLVNADEGQSITCQVTGTNGIGSSTATSNALTVSSLLLDLYPNSTVAYSLRKLRTAYSGSAIRVRRSSDNAEQNIAFVGNNLDTSSLLTFCGAGNGFVTTWYDQSGNANNATQSTATTQPQIVSSGVILTLNTKPRILFNSLIGSTKSLFSSNTFSFGDSTILLIGSQRADGAAARFIDHDFSNGFWFGRSAAGTDAFGGGWKQGSAPYGVFQAIANNTQFIFSAYRSGATSYISINNNANTSITTSSGNTNSNIIGLGTVVASSANLSDKDIQEVIIYNSNKSTDILEMKTNQNNFYSTY